MSGTGREIYTNPHTDSALSRVQVDSLGRSIVLFIIPARYSQLATALLQRGVRPYTVEKTTIPWEYSKDAVAKIEIWAYSISQEGRIPVGIWDDVVAALKSVDDKVDEIFCQDVKNVIGLIQFRYERRHSTSDVLEPLSPSRALVPVRQVAKVEKPKRPTEAWPYFKDSWIVSGTLNLESVPAEDIAFCRHYETLSLFYAQHKWSYVASPSFLNRHIIDCVGMALCAAQEYLHERMQDVSMQEFLNHVNMPAPASPAKERLPRMRTFKAVNDMILDLKDTKIAELRNDIAPTDALQLARKLVGGIAARVAKKIKPNAATKEACWVLVGPTREQQKPVFLEEQLRL